MKKSFSSKAAISFFSDALADEFKHTNIKIQCLIPSLVSTKLASYEPGDTELFVVDTNVFAKQAVNIIGKCRLSTGCFQHDLQVCLVIKGVAIWILNCYFDR